MKKYNIIFSKRAEKDILKLPAVIVEKIIPVIILLEEEPRPIGCKKLKGYTNYWRVRIGDYRVIYTIEETILVIDVREVGHRKDIYK